MQIVKADGFKKQYAFTHLMKIELSCFECDHVTRKDFKDNYETTYFLVDIDQNIIGYYMWCPENDYAYLYSIAIDKYYQGNGYSKIMLDHFLSTSGYESHCLHVNTNNKKAIDLYQKYGFVQGELYPSFYENGEDATIMLKKKNET